MFFFSFLNPDSCVKKSPLNSFFMIFAIFCYNFGLDSFTDIVNIGDFYYAYEQESGIWRVGMDSKDQFELWHEVKLTEFPGKSLKSISLSKSIKNQANNQER